MTLREIKNKTINKAKVAMFVLSSSLLLTSCGKANIDEPVDTKEEVNVLEDKDILVEEMPEQVIDEPIVEEQEEIDKELEQEYYSYYIDLSNYVGDSLTEALKENGYEYSFNFRKSIAKDLMMPNYVSTQAQDLAILAICGGSLTITDEDLIKEVDELIDACLRNIGLGYIKEEKITKRKNKKENESVDATAYKIVPVEPKKIPVTTNWTSSLGENSPTYNTGNNDNSNNSDNNDNDDDNKDDKKDNKDNKKKHNHKYSVTISYESNKDGKTHKKIQIKKCKDNDSTIVKILVEKEPCKEGKVKVEGEYECYYCEHCNQLLRKVKKHHKHEFKETDSYISNNDGKTHTVKTTKKCLCGYEETYTKNPGEVCTEGQAKREGEYDNYYCTKCGQLLRQVKVEEEHKHNHTEYVGSTYKGNGKHDATYKCSCGETITKEEDCTKTTKEEGNYKITYCSKCGYEFERKLIEEEQKHNHNWVKDSTTSNNDGTHTVTYKCISTIGKCDQPTKTETESCTHHHTEKIGCEEFYYCSCGYKMESLGVNHTSGAPETDYTYDPNSYCYKVTVKCSACGETLVDGETVGHSFPSGNPGETVSCTKCGAEKTIPGEIKPDPVPDPVPDPTPTPDPVPDPTPDPVPDPVPDPIPDPVPDPTPTPNPTPDPTPTLEEYGVVYVNEIKNLAIRTINNQKRDYIYYKNTLEILLDKRKYMTDNYGLKRKK